MVGKDVCITEDVMLNNGIGGVLWVKFTIVDMRELLGIEN
jgi:hypothetical protein